MKHVVIDTYILVAALWNQDGVPAHIVRMVLTQQLTICYDYRIFEEYADVLRRQNLADIHDLLDGLKNGAISIAAKPADIAFSDETDRKFYEVAKECGAILITGNGRHYPDEPFIMTARAFLAYLSSNSRSTSAICPSAKDSGTYGWPQTGHAGSSF
jgi:putative PIN family toxin of toxin-antitoxin system